MSELNTPFWELNRAYGRFREARKTGSPVCGERLFEVFGILLRTLCKVRTQAYLYSELSEEALNLSLLHFYSPAGQEEARTGIWAFYTRLLEKVLGKNGIPTADLDRLLALEKLLPGREGRKTDKAIGSREIEEGEKLILKQMEQLDFFRMTLRRGTEHRDEGPLLCGDEGCFPVTPLFFPNGEGLLEERKKTKNDDTESLIYDGRSGKIKRSYRRFQDETRGDFHESLKNFIDEYGRRDYRVYPEVREELQRLVEEGPAFIKLIGRPLTGKSTLTAHIDAYVSGALPFRIDYGLLSHHAGAFEAFVKRELKKKLRSLDGTEPPGQEDDISSLVEKLEKKKNRLVIAVDNAQLIALLRPGSYRKIIDLMGEWKLPRERASSLVFILVTRYASAEALPGRPLSIPDAYTRIRSLPEKREALLKIISEKDRLAEQLIGALLAEMEPVPLRRLSEKVEKSLGKPVFTPILKISLETVLADLILKNERGWYAIWEQLRN